MSASTEPAGRKPSLEEVREFVDKLLSLPGWIGEGEEIATDILAFIEGDQEVLTSWRPVFDRHGIR